MLATARKLCLVRCARIDCSSAMGMSASIPRKRAAAARAAGVASSRVCGDYHIIGSTVHTIVHTTKLIETYLSSDQILVPTGPHAPRVGIRGRNQPTVSHAPCQPTRRPRTLTDPFTYIYMYVHVPTPTARVVPFSPPSTHAVCTYTHIVPPARPPQLCCSCYVDGVGLELLLPRAAASTAIDVAAAGAAAAAAAAVAADAAAADAAATAVDAAAIAATAAAAAPPPGRWNKSMKCRRKAPVNS